MARQIDFLNSLPRTIRHRLDGIGSYVSEVLKAGGLDQHLRRKQIERIRMMAMLRTLYDLLRDGSFAARSAVGAFQSVGVEEFKIGTQTFAEGSDAVVRGDRLADELRRIVGESDLQHWLTSNQSLRDLILRAGREGSRGRYSRMD